MGAILQNEAGSTVPESGSTRISTDARGNSVLRSASRRSVGSRESSTGTSLSTTRLKSMKTSGPDRRVGRVWYLTCSDWCSRMICRIRPSSPSVRR